MTQTRRHIEQFDPPAGWRSVLALALICCVGLLGPVATAYPGREPDAPWRQEANRRIHDLRRGDLTVRVVNAQGDPQPGVMLHVEQTRHAFGFGAAIGALTYMEDSTRGQQYRRLINDVFGFNEIVFENDLKPYRFADHRQASSEGRAGLTEVKAAIADLRERGVRIRGHYLNHGMLIYRKGKTNYMPEFREDAEALQAELLSEAIDRAQAVGLLVDEWDAVNHIAGWGQNFNWRNLTGRLDYAAPWLEQLRAGVPDGLPLYINEGNVLSDHGTRADDYFAVAQALVDAGAPLDGIGFMGHFKTDEETFDSGALTPPRQQLEILDRFAALGLPLKITEFDIDAGADDALQADFIRDAMIVAFSHPAVESFVMWGFWEGKHWRKPAALVRLDGSMRPSGDVWLDLVYRQWWTDAVVRTDERGVAVVPAFYGDYQVRSFDPDGVYTVEATHRADDRADVLIER